MTKVVRVIRAQKRATSFRVIYAGPPFGTLKPHITSNAKTSRSPLIRTP
jgi:hypothetical protein